MKKYFIDIRIGFLLGAVFFFGVELILRESILSLTHLYYFVFIPVFAIYALNPLFKKRLVVSQNKLSFIFFSFLSFSLGFSLWWLGWGIIVLLALRNASFIL